MTSIFSTSYLSYEHYYILDIFSNVFKIFVITTFFTTSGCIFEQDLLGVLNKFLAEYSVTLSEYFEKCDLKVRV